MQAAIVATLMLLLYSDVIRDLVLDWWNEPNLSHGLLIPPFAAWIVWMRRGELLAEPVAPDSRGIWLAGAACLLFLAGKLAAEFFLTRTSLLLLGAALIWTFWGRQRLKALGFPLLLLASSIPLPVIVYNAVAAPLQLFASDVAANAAQLLGVTVFRDGNVIYLANTSLGVEEACSGLNSLSALMVASILLGFLMFSRPLARVLLFLFAIPLSIAVNIFRVTGTAIMADYHEEFAMGFYHSFSGWLVFVLAFALLYGTARVMTIFVGRNGAQQ